MKKFKKILATAMAGVMAVSTFLIPGIGTLKSEAAEDVTGYRVTVDGEFASFDGETDYDTIAWTKTDKYAKTVAVKNCKETEVTIDFGVDVSFTGNFVGLETDIPYDEYASYELKSISFDGGEPITPATTVATSEGIDGGTRFTLTNGWNDKITTQPYEGTIWQDKIFKKLTAIFVVDAPMKYTAQLDGEFASFDGETDYDTIAWTKTDEYAQEISVKSGSESSVTIDFGVDVSFTGNFVGLETDIPYDENSEYELKSISFDGGEQITSAATVVTSEGIDGGTRFTLTNGWNDKITTQPYEGTMWQGKVFKKLTAVFVVKGISTKYNTMLDGEFASFDGETDYDTIAWTKTDKYAQAVSVVEGKDSSVTIDFGVDVSFTGNFVGFETDIPYDESSNYVLKSISFDEGEPIIPATTVVTSEGIDGGTRFTLTNGWNDKIATQPYESTIWADKTFKKLTVKFAVSDIPVYVYDIYNSGVANYKIDISVEGKGSATASANKAEEGAEVTLNAVPFSGYQFKEWKVTPSAVVIKDNKFVMPAEDVSIVAVFEKKEEVKQPEKPVDDKEVITETKFGPEKITASNNYVISSKDYPVNPVKLDMKLSFNKAFWNDWCQVFFKVDYDGKTKYIVYAGNQAKWNTTVGYKTKDIVYVVPVSGKTKEGSEIIVDNYDIVLMDSTGEKNAKFDYDITIKEIAGCKDWSVTFYCPAWCDPDTVTLTDVDGKTKDLMAEVKDVYDAEGNKVLNDDGSTKTEPVITSKEDAYIYRASGIVYTSSKEVEKAPEPAKKGTALTVGAGKYKVTSTDVNAPTVAFTAPKSKTATSVTIPATIKDENGVTYKVTSVAANAFAKNTKVKKVEIGKNVKTIGAGAFSGCTKLATVTFKGTAVTSIGKNAFKGDKALKSIVITKKVKTIGASAFEGCTKLAKVTMKSTKLATVGNKAFAKCTALKSLIFPATCKKLGASVFTGDKKLKTLTLKSTKITTKTLNKNTFKGTVKTIKVKVPSKKVAAYKKLFATKGLNKKAKVTK